MNREELRVWSARARALSVFVTPPEALTEALDRLDATLDQLDAAEARLAAVRELHRPVGRFGYCATCAYAIYPCPTIRALDGRADA